MLLSIFLACYPTYNAQNFPEDPGHDYDNDGLTELEGDCEDLDGNIYPGAAALDPGICGPDNDGDGYAPEDVGGNDCDDLNPSADSCQDLSQNQNWLECKDQE